MERTATLEPKVTTPAVSPTPLGTRSCQGLGGSGGGGTFNGGPVVVGGVVGKASLLTTPVPPVNVAVNVVLLAALVTVVAAAVNDVITGFGTTVSVAVLGAAALPVELLSVSV